MLILFVLITFFYILYCLETIIKKIGIKIDSLMIFFITLFIGLLVYLFEIDLPDFQCDWYTIYEKDTVHIEETISKEKTVKKTLSDTDMALCEKKNGVKEIIDIENKVYPDQSGCIGKLEILKKSVSPGYGGYTTRTNLHNLTFLGFNTFISTSEKCLDNTYNTYTVPKGSVVVETVWKGKHKDPDMTFRYVYGVGYVDKRVIDMLSSKDLSDNLKMHIAEESLPLPNYIPTCKLIDEDIKNKINYEPTKFIGWEKDPVSSYKRLRGLGQVVHRGSHDNE